MRVTAEIDLDEETQTALHRILRRRTTPVRVAGLCRIVLLSAEPLPDKRIAERLSVAPRR